MTDYNSEWTGTSTKKSAIKGERRYILTGPQRFELCECTMILGMQFADGKEYREVLWQLPNGRSHQSSGHENWVKK